MLLPRFILAMTVMFSIASCSQDQSSQALDIADFDAQDFNSGNTFEDLVNPQWRLDGEEGAEEVGSMLNQTWLSRVDAEAKRVEWQNFVSTQDRMSEEQIDRHNTALEDILSRANESENGFTFEEAKLLYQWLVQQDQVRLHSRYSPNRHDVNVGFCFGRAMIVHSLAKHAYIGNEDGTKDLRGNVPVRKIWVTGPMGMWKHHVATMVMAKEAEAGFWVIDNYVGRIVSAKDWMKELKRRHPGVDVLFNVSRANRFSEANNLRYYQVLLDDEWFEGFFQDFLKTNVLMIRDLGGVNLSKSFTQTRQEYEASQNDDGDVDQPEEPSVDDEPEVVAFGGEGPPVSPNNAAPGTEILN